MNQDWINALIGGGIIGVAVSLMLLWNGRVTGISGIVNGALNPTAGDTQWRLFFIGGLFVGGLIVGFFNPAVFGGALATEAWTVPVAGLLVGFGTIMGSGCTSGHGVCGISRFSPRSLISTLTFIVAGMLAVVLFRQWGILP